MNIKAKFDHYNFNVFNLQKSLDFYKKALGLNERKRKTAEDGSFILVFLCDNESGFSLELTWLRDWEKPYELGDNETHLCVKVNGDYDEIRNFHKEMNCVCYENIDMGLYFISDPDNHWIEILPAE